MAFNPGTVDLVGLSPDGSVVDLFIVRATPWAGTDEDLMSLQAKIHTYVGFALDGQLTAAYPEVRGLPWRIVIDSQAGPPDDRTMAMLDAVRDRISEHGGDLLASSPYRQP